MKSMNKGFAEKLNLITALSVGITGLLYAILEHFYLSNLVLIEGIILLVILVAIYLTLKSYDILITVIKGKYPKYFETKNVESPNNKSPDE